MDFAVTADQRLKMKESEKIGEYLDLARELTKQWNMMVYGYTNTSWSTWNGPQGLGKETGKIGNQRKNRSHTDDSTGKIGSGAWPWKRNNGRLGAFN